MPATACSVRAVCVQSVHVARVSTAVYAVCVQCTVCAQRIRTRLLRVILRAPRGERLGRDEGDAHMERAVSCAGPPRALWTGRPFAAVPQAPTALALRLLLLLLLPTLRRLRRRRRLLPLHHLGVHVRHLRLVILLQPLLHLLREHVHHRTAQQVLILSLPAHQLLELRHLLLVDSLDPSHVEHGRGLGIGGRVLHLQGGGHVVVVAARLRDDGDLKRLLLVLRGERRRVRPWIALGSGCAATHQLYKILHVHRLEHHQLVLLLLGIIHGRQRQLLGRKVPAATAELAPARVGRQGGQERTKFVSTTKKHDTG